MANDLAIRKNKIEKLKAQLNQDSVQEQFRNALKENSGPFVASVIDLYGSDTYLQDCDPTAVVMECLKAATLKLPINKQLGFAYVVPYKKAGKAIPQFQLGYKGYIQLAMRSGQYKTLNAGQVGEGVTVKHDLLTGKIELVGEPKKNAKTIGYFCHMELINGFVKTLYMTKEQAEAWGKRYSKSYSKDTSPWKTNFEEMALKTTVRRLLSKWGIMSIEMQQAFETDVEAEVAEEIAANANRGPIIDITPEAKELPAHDPDAGEIKTADAKLSEDELADIEAAHQAELAGNPGY